MVKHAPRESALESPQMATSKPDPATPTAISLKGFKSFAEERSLEIRPLTLFAGANSSGKSSALQPLLLMKQTLDPSYDPGALLLNGSHVRFTSARQMLTRDRGLVSTEFEISIQDRFDRCLRQTFRRNDDDGFDLAKASIQIGDDVLDLLPALSSAEIKKSVAKFSTRLNYFVKANREVTAAVRRDRCFLDVIYGAEPSSALSLNLGVRVGFSSPFDRIIRSILHVPGLRGNPERSYPVTAVSDAFSGTFEAYSASVVASWQRGEDERLEMLERNLTGLGLTSRVQARPVDATQVELMVSRFPHRTRVGPGDFVNMADVGLGVSQVLPVLVALLTARPGQLVYLEQPELHLHPRAQQALAAILGEAANRGVRVVAETHSSILLLAVQTLVAEGKLASDKVKLHWFTRSSAGFTNVDSGDIDGLGAYGDWPEDFGATRASAENQYLDAVEAKAFSLGGATKKKHA